MKLALFCFVKKTNELKTTQETIGTKIIQLGLREVAQQLGDQRTWVRVPALTCHFTAVYNSSSKGIS